MKQFDFVVQSSVGIHARPAMLLAQKARNLTSSVTISHKGRTANAKNMAALLTLRVYQSGTVTFFLEGENEEAETKELMEFCKQNL